MKYKYPRTFHLPWSPGSTSDDKVLVNTDHFNDRDVVVTEKRDGENSSLYHNYYHARSLDSKDHESRHWLKCFWATIKHEIPKNIRICGENLYAQHSIHYIDLISYFEAFSIWERDICLSWSDTKEYCELLKLSLVPVIYEGKYGTDKMWSEITSLVIRDNVEGYVIRIADKFSYHNFNISLAKWVRKNHVQTDQHWMSKPVIPNNLKE